jgi:galactose oxidase
MRSNRNITRRAMPVFALFAVALCPGLASAQVREVVVGVTPTCPYGLTACWAGAYEALGRMDGVESVDKAPNAYNCSAAVRFKGEGLPDPERWASQFKAVVDQAYGFRGVEVTVAGQVEKSGESLVIRVPGVEKPIALKALEHKIQLNPKKGEARQPEPEEHDAYDHLAKQLKAAEGGVLKVQLTGPLTKSTKGYSVEVREFFQPAKPAKDQSKK